MWDVIIIGGGPAGLAAGLYAARGALKTLLIENMYPGGQAATTPLIENYPGFADGIGGAQLGVDMEKQAKRFGLEILYQNVTQLDLKGDIKTVVTSKGEQKAKAVILCMGVVSRTLGLPEEQRYTGNGVSYCAVCDGAFYREREVAVVGGGDSAVEEALYLTQYCPKVHLIHRRDELRAGKASQKRILGHEQVVFHWDSVVKKLEGSLRLERVMLENVKTGQVQSLPIDGLFVSIGRDPSNALVQGQLTLEGGYVPANEVMETEIPGVYIAGDLRVKPLRQVVTAVADGALAGWAAQRYLIQSCV